MLRISTLHLGQKSLHTRYMHAYECAHNSLRPGILLAFGTLNRVKTNLITTDTTRVHLRNISFLTIQYRIHFVFLKFTLRPFPSNTFF